MASASYPVELDCSRGQGSCPPTGFADVHFISIEPQRLRATKPTPVTKLGGMAFVNPPVTADTYRPSGRFLSLCP